MTGLRVAVDSNLLLLLVVGSASRDYIARHKRLKAFDVSDFDLLVRELSVASTLVLTPNTLTETSNLIDHIADPARGHIYQTLRALLQQPEADERHVPALKATAAHELPRLGLTDCTLLELCVQGIPLITADLPLFLAALGRGAQAINFNHLRDQAL